jgi:hypothetical protein
VRVCVYLNVCCAVMSVWPVDLACVCTLLSSVSYEEEDTCVSYEEEDTCVAC